MAKTDKELYSKVLPRTRVKLSQLEQLYSDAEKRGFKRKLAAYIRIRLFGGKLPEIGQGLSSDDAARILSIVAKGRLSADGNQPVLECFNAIARLCLNAINDDPQKQHQG